MILYGQKMHTGEEFLTAFLSWNAEPSEDHGSLKAVGPGFKEAVETNVGQKKGHGAKPCPSIKKPDVS
jgi:hypothetical protein